MPASNELEPQPLSWADVAPFAATATVTVDAAPDAVWAVLVDHRRWPRWFGAVKACEPTSADESGVGSTRRVTLAGGVTVDERFIAWEQPSLWAFTAVAGPGVGDALVERVDLAAAPGDRTTVTYRMAAEPRRGWGALFAAVRPLVAANLRRALRSLGEEARRRGNGRSG